MSGKDSKPKTESGTPGGTGKGANTQPDLAKLIEAYQSVGGGVAEGPSFTTQDAEAYVQSIYNQILGRNANGAERTRAIGIFMNQQAETDVTGRQAAIVSAIESTPEYKKRQENRYLDAIYQAVAEDVRRAQA